MLFSSLDNSSVSDVVIIFLLVSFGGFLGSLVDTILGATLQSTFVCPSCEKITEKTYHYHEVDVKTQHMNGIRLIDNDAVNFLSGTVASLIAVIMYRLIL